MSSKPPTIGVFCTPATFETDNSNPINFNLYDCRGWKPDSYVMQSGPKVDEFQRSIDNNNRWRWWWWLWWWWWWWWVDRKLAWNYFFQVAVDSLVISRRGGLPFLAFRHAILLPAPVGRRKARERPQYCPDDETVEIELPTCRHRHGVTLSPAAAWRRCRDSRDMLELHWRDEALHPVARLDVRQKERRRYSAKMKGSTIAYFKARLIFLISFPKKVNLHHRLRH